MLFEAQFKVVTPNGELSIPFSCELQYAPTPEQLQALGEKAIKKALATYTPGLQSVDAQNAKNAKNAAKKAATQERRAAAKAVKAAAAAERKAAREAEKREEKVQNALERVLKLLAALAASAKATPSERMIADRADLACVESLVRDCVARGVRDPGRVAFSRYLFRALYLRVTAINTAVSIDDYKAEQPALAKYEARVLNAGFNPISESKLASATAKAA